MKIRVEDLMTVDEILTHIRAGEALKFRGTLYVLSPTHYKRLEKSLEHYLNTGEIFEGQYGLQKKEEK